MNVAVKAIGMFNKLNVPIIGVIENMSHLECPHCQERIVHNWQRRGSEGQREIQRPFRGEIPLHPQIMGGKRYRQTNNSVRTRFDSG